MESTRTVFSKTEKGREEMAKRSYGLNPAQRRVLILIDGSKDVDTLAEMNPALAASGQLDGILACLLEEGFVISAEVERQAQTYPGSLGVTAAPRPAAEAARPDAPEQERPGTRSQEQTWPGAAGLPSLSAVSVPAVSDGTNLTEDPATIRQVKDFMTTTAQTYLGLLSAPLIQRIEQARGASQLMAVTGQWNMALRDSAQGRRFADPYLEQVRTALAAGAKPALQADA